MQTVKPEDLTTVAKLGSGAFGVVTLVKQGTSYYALKQMHKSQIVQMELQASPPIYTHIDLPSHSDPTLNDNLSVISPQAIGS